MSNPAPAADQNGAEVPAEELEVQELEPVELEPVKSSALALSSDAAQQPDAIAPFASLDNFKLAQTMALSLASSSLVPAHYRGRANVGSVLIALEMASRVRASVLMVMQNLFVIEGKPAWSSTFLIALLNSCGRFTPIRFEFEGTPSQNGWKCRAIAREKATGERLEGEWITWEMAKAEGWVSRNKSKWQTMPGQMMRYRAAAFFSRVYAPEISLGMHTVDEIEDVTGVQAGSPGARDLNAALGIVPPAPATASVTGPALNTSDKPCPDCSAAPGKPHGDACPWA